MKSINNKSTIPVPTIRRLPQYHSFLISIKNKGIKFISAPDIGKELHIHSTQITKDFSYIVSERKQRNALVFN